MCVKRRVAVPHEASYPDPISVQAGDPLILSGRRDIWDGHLWLWAQGPDGREGWVPDTLAAGDADQPRAAFDYSAAELTCARGDILDAHHTSHGWVWCTVPGDAAGWVPARKLATAPARRCND